MKQRRSRTQNSHSGTTTRRRRRSNGDEMGDLGEMIAPGRSSGSRSTSGARGRTTTSRSRRKR